MDQGFSTHKWRWHQCLRLRFLSSADLATLQSHGGYVSRCYLLILINRVPPDAPTTWAFSTTTSNLPDTMLGRFRLRKRPSSTSLLHRFHMKFKHRGHDLANRSNEWNIPLPPDLMHHIIDTYLSTCTIMALCVAFPVLRSYCHPQPYQHIAIYIGYAQLPEKLYVRIELFQCPPTPMLAQKKRAASFPWLAIWRMTLSKERSPKLVRQKSRIQVCMTKCRFFYAFLTTVVKISSEISQMLQEFVSIISQTLVVHL